MNAVLLHRGHFFQREAERINHESYFSNNESVLLSKLNRDHKQNKENDKAVVVINARYRENLLRPT